MSSVLPLMAMLHQPAPGLVLDSEHAAVYCGIAVGTLWNLRSKGEAPKAHKHGRKTVYYPADLDAWLKTRIVPAQ